MKRSASRSIVFQPMPLAQVQATHQEAVERSEIFDPSYWDLLSDGVLITDADGQIVAANSAAQRFLQEGAPFWQASAPTAIPATLIGSDFAHAMRGFAPVEAKADFSWEALALRPSSSDPNCLAIHHLHDPEPFRRRATLRYQSSLYQHQPVTVWIWTASTALHAAETLRDHALHFLGHDLRAPFAAMLALLGLSQTPGSKISVDKLLGLIQEHARRALEQSENFLLLAQSQMRASQAATVDLNQLAQDAVDNAWNPAQERKVTLEIACAPTELWVQADRFLLTTAFGQLLSNAIRHSGPNTNVIVSTDLQTATQPCAVFAVEDQGPELSLQMRQALLANARSTGRDHGPGLGLRIVQNVMARHGGTLSIRTGPQGGTCFAISLPLASL